MAKAFGLPVTPLRPGLTPLLAPSELAGVCREMAGLSLPARIKTAGRAFGGSLLFTHKGVSGPAVLNASLYWRRGMELYIDFAPGADIVETARAAPRAEFATALAGIAPRKLARALCERHGWGGRCAEISGKQLRAMDELIHAYPFAARDAEGHAKAEVTLGGVDVEAISSKTMEAKDVPGLYFIGEVLDVTGALGGFNLQWAWASGRAAGAAA